MLYLSTLILLIIDPEQTLNQTIYKLFNVLMNLVGLKFYFLEVHKDIIFYATAALL